MNKPREPIEQLKWAAFRLSTAPPDVQAEAQEVFDAALESVERTVAELRAVLDGIASGEMGVNLCIKHAKAAVARLDGSKP